MSWLSVADAASRLELDVSRVRALASGGDIDARQVGGRWIIDEAALERFAAARRFRRSGRPFQPSAAWGLLALAAGRPTEWISRSEHERLAGVLHGRDLEQLVGQLRRRAKVQRWHVHPSLVDRLVGEDGVVMGGARASRELARDPGPAEVYVRADVVPRLRKQYSPDVGAEEHNLVVRIIDEPWPFEAQERVVWPIVAAIDLLESHPDDARCRAVAERILESVHA